MLNKIIYGACLAFVLSACNSGSEESNAAPTSTTVPLKGVFLDSPVKGVSYVTPTQRGVTNENGEFSYLPGEKVTFSIGNVRFPSVAANTAVTPLDMANSFDINNQIVSNILVLLQSLDEDGNPDNGISISSTLAERATTPIDFDINPVEFSTNTAVIGLVTYSGNKTKALVAESEAKAHFQSAIKGVSSTVNDDLTAIAGTMPTANSVSVCGYDVGKNVLTGSVSAVHDGDTITVTSAGQQYKIRLDSIDAPELKQPYGIASRDALINAVLGKPVKVAYTKIDKYGRYIGAVFTDSCEYVNLKQVSTGMAWFYRFYQCEISAAARSQASCPVPDDC